MICCGPVSSSLTRAAAWGGWGWAWGAIVVRGRPWRGVEEPQACLLPAGHLGCPQQPSPRQHLSASGPRPRSPGGSLRGPEWSAAAAQASLTTAEAGGCLWATTPWTHCAGPPPPVRLCGVELSPGRRAPVTQTCWCAQARGLDSMVTTGFGGQSRSEATFASQSHRRAKAQTL